MAGAEVFCYPSLRRVRTARARSDGPGTCGRHPLVPLHRHRGGRGDAALPRRSARPGHHHGGARPPPRRPRRGRELGRAPRAGRRFTWRRTAAHRRRVRGGGAMLPEPGPPPIGSTSWLVPGVAVGARSTPVRCLLAWPNGCRTSSTPLSRSNRSPRPSRCVSTPSRRPSCDGTVQQGCAGASEAPVWPPRPPPPPHLVHHAGGSCRTSTTSRRCSPSTTSRRCVMPENFSR